MTHQLCCELHFLNFSCYFQCIFIGSGVQKKHAGKITCVLINSMGADKPLARPNFRCILFDGQNISFGAILVIYTNSINIPPIMIINRIYKTKNLLSLQLVSFLVGLRTYQHPSVYQIHAASKQTKFCQSYTHDVKRVERAGCKPTSHQLLSKITTNVAVPLKTIPQTCSLINHQCF